MVHWKRDHTLSLAAWWPPQGWPAADGKRRSEFTETMEVFFCFSERQCLGEEWAPCFAGREASEAERARAANFHAPARPNPTEQSGAQQKLMPISDKKVSTFLRLFLSLLWFRARFERHFSIFLWLRAAPEARAPAFSVAPGQA